MNVGPHNWKKEHKMSPRLKAKIPDLLILFLLVEWLCRELCDPRLQDPRHMAFKMKSLDIQKRIIKYAFSGGKEEVLSRVLPCLEAEPPDPAIGNFFFFQWR